MWRAYRRVFRHLGGRFLARPADKVRLEQKVASANGKVAPIQAAKALKRTMSASARRKIVAAQTCETGEGEGEAREESCLAEPFLQVWQPRREDA
jgi:hypothetical protein